METARRRKLREIPRSDFIMTGRYAPLPMTTEQTAVRRRIRKP